MAKEDRETRGSHFVITLKDDHSLDSSHVVFGKLVEGFYTLGKIRDTGVRFPVQIFNSGLHYEGDSPWYLWKGQKPENVTGVLPDGLKSTVQIEGGGALDSDDGKAQTSTGLRRSLRIKHKAEALSGKGLL
ncbi:uncharacterized protein LOC129317873 isoform X2 [Prosopis cineraria]|uniref:uncharacterized protein LOC129317873 isoform X2 n=1 Tax=Prosopis cineraria TaxID=364024 RepID=UPI0024103466|nr:uncharacterized protein LOC129317873 isoform X2 [Prosopis cineraria]XP_054818254.1 uncharacterized protein LOC129317873 isoform X2 [Prosopis cineraria]XP_054818255.1 uncharacterized protein LOC129317873 isoform X2 [Prosopis cineraria]XP_054818256.1 uncharacterized protein LOC129317873 isoform X2 [Prosopis cineraria]XP_054818258.1 uncharacterized protein LOC129317873 isoform X2 [Prosopis cineraria]